jgi:hypothetical protein
MVKQACVLRAGPSHQRAPAVRTTLGDGWIGSTAGMRLYRGNKARNGVFASLDIDRDP